MLLSAGGCFCVKGEVVGQSEDEGKHHPRHGQVQAGATEFTTKRDKGVDHGHVPLNRKRDGHINRHYHSSLMVRYILFVIFLSFHT